MTYPHPMDDTTGFDPPETQGSESLSLKWGTIKGWDLKQEKTREIMKRYVDLGASWAGMQQRDTPEQKKLICELIDAVDGPIWNDWSGEKMTKEAAKDYVNKYQH